MDARLVLKNTLDEVDYENLGKAVTTAYKACNALMENNTVLNNSIVGMEQRSRLISVFVEHSLAGVCGFTSEIKPNAANNCHHTRISKNNFVITAHFLGRGARVRKLPNCAINRAMLSDRNMSLFPDEEGNIPDFCSENGGYGWVLHHGLVEPQTVSLAIPTRDQRDIYAFTPLPVVDVKVSEIEEIREEVSVKLISSGKMVAGNEN